MLQIMAGVPFLGTAAACSSPNQGTGSASGNATPALFDELGIEPVINGRGTLTFLSGSLMMPETVAAIQQTSTQFARLMDVQNTIGEKLAEMLGSEAAMVTAGAASAMTLGTAACITGEDQDKIRLLPNLPGPKPQVIIQDTHRFGYDHAVRNCGVEMVEVNGPEEMAAAINDRTVMALYYNAAGRSSITREEFVAIGKEHGVPTFNDAAADVPPVDHLHDYIEMGFDLVTFSGGKAIRGPQSTGLLYGRKDLIEAAKLNHSPNGNTIGRGMKVNKEEMFGLYVAIKSYLERDHEAEWAEWEGRIARITEIASAVPTVQGETDVNPGPANHFPGLRLSWDQEQVNISPREVVQQLRDGKPSIEVGGNDETLNIAVVMLKPEQVDIVGERVREVLQQAV
ncbi:MAG: aminotransferase class V-fold PLP-dependent enzyme [Balneolaceae bacterium]